MGRAERQRWENNDIARDLIEASRNRRLTPEEIELLRKSYTGYGGLGWNTTQHFTPRVVCRFVVDLLNIQPGHQVFEPSCGGGAFLQELPEGCHATGIELMVDAAEVAHLCNPDATIIQGDALQVEDIEEKFDFAIGNPPFDKLPKSRAPEGFTLGPMSDRLEWYFVELAYRSLKPGGIMALVVPDGILSNTKDQKARKWILENAWYRASISLPGETFKHSGTGCKTSVMVVQKPIPGHVLKVEDQSVLMSVCEHIGWNSRGKETGLCDLPKILEYAREEQPIDLTDRCIPEPVAAPHVHVKPDQKSDGDQQMSLF